MVQQELLTGIRPGDVVRDVISGIEGVATGVCMHITGCDTVGIFRPVDKDGKVPDIFWADANRLEVITRNSVKLPGLPTSAERAHTQEHGAMDSPTASRSMPR